MRREINTVGVILVCAVMGIVFAMIVQNLNTQGILIPMLLDSVNLTIGHLMFLTFFIWLIIGVVLGMLLF